MEAAPSSSVASLGVTRRVTRSVSRSKAAAATTAITTTTTTAVTETPQPSRRSNLANTPISTRRVPPISSQRFGLIQESVATDLYALLVAAVLWNRTRGTQARPVFETIMARYPTPEKLAEARQEDLAEMIHPLGLYNTRARRFLAFARTWVESPPSPRRRYRRLHYPVQGAGADISKDEVLDEQDEREAWEVAHLPSIGPYALDSFRIFHRDMLRGLATDWTGSNSKPGFEPEWKRVVPTDKELKAYLQWMWLKEGWVWDPTNGARRRASRDRMNRERARRQSIEPHVSRIDTS